MMYNSDTDFLFPPRVIPFLREARGEGWQGLVDGVSDQEADSLDRLSFVLMMVRLLNCTGCRADSSRGLGGCTHCAQQSLRRFRGDDQDLLDLFTGARREVEQFFAVNTGPKGVETLRA